MRRARRLAACVAAATAATWTTSIVPHAPAHTGFVAGSGRTIVIGPGRPLPRAVQLGGVRNPVGCHVGRVVHVWQTTPSGAKLRRVGSYTTGLHPTRRVGYASFDYSSIAPLPERFYVVAETPAKVLGSSGGATPGQTSPRGGDFGFDVVRERRRTRHRHMCRPARSRVVTEYRRGYQP